MSIQTANSQFSFQLPSLSYIDAKWEEPNLRVTDPEQQRSRRLGLADRLSGLVTAFTTWRRNSIAANELAAMSDYELADIGLNRSDLSRVFDPRFNLDLRDRGNQV
jgi:uncharacterized protein YjiS (DUF1127 family)